MHRANNRNEIKIADTSGQIQKYKNQSKSAFYMGTLKFLSISIWYRHRIKKWVVCTQYSGYFAYINKGK